MFPSVLCILLAPLANHTTTGTYRTPVQSPPATPNCQINNSEVTISNEHLHWAT